MRVLNRLANVLKEPNPIDVGQPRGIAVVRDRRALHVFHGEVRLPVGRAAGVEDPGDAGVFHQRQRLALELEPRQHSF